MMEGKKRGEEWLQEEWGRGWKRRRAERETRRGQEEKRRKSEKGKEDS